MQTITQQVIIPSNHKLHLDLSLPAGSPPGPAEVLIVINPQSSASPSSRVLGLAAGKIKCADDFDEPLADAFWTGDS